MGVLIAVLAALCSIAVAADRLVWVGTSGATGSGIYAFRFDPSTGALTPTGLAVETDSPAFLAIHPNGRVLYTVNHRGTQALGSVTAFTIEGTNGHLRLLNRVSTRGFGPCHLAVDQTGRMLAVANYGSGSLVTYPIRADGSLGETSGFRQNEGSSVDLKDQQGPHAHCVTFSPDNRFLMLADLGLDKIFSFRVNPANASMALDGAKFAVVKPGSGPRHFVFHASGHYAYAVTEMGSSVIAFAYRTSDGTLSEIQTISILPKDFTGKSRGAEIEVDAAGKFLYASNRGHDSIAVLSIDSGSGRLSLVERLSSGGKTPGQFRIDPTGKWLIVVNQNSNQLTVFRRNAQTGRLTRAGEAAVASQPQCVLFQRRTGSAEEKEP